VCAPSPPPSQQPKVLIFILGLVIFQQQLRPCWAPLDWTGVAFLSFPPLYPPSSFWCCTFYFILLDFILRFIPRVCCNINKQYMQQNITQLEPSSHERPAPMSIPVSIGGDGASGRRPSLRTHTHTHILNGMNWNI
jgi:hypothetical protein